MMIETIGDAFNHSVKATMACAEGKGDGMKKHRECIFRCELDMMTMVCTHGRTYPMGLLQNRLKCPRCGSRRVRLIWLFPDNVRSGSVALL